MVRRGDVVEVEISEIDGKGRGIGFLDGRGVYVYFTVPGDLAKVKIVRVGRRGLTGSLLEVKSPSKFRVKPKCRFFGLCGGCKLQNTEYTQQLVFKRRFVRRAFQRFDVDVEVEKVVPSKFTWFYRNRMDYVVGLSLEVGLRAPEDWRRVVDISECLLLSEAGNKFLRCFKEFIRERRLEAFDTRSLKGFLRYLVLREGKFTGDKMVNLVTYVGEFQGLDEIKEKFVNLGATSIYWSVNPRVTDVSYGEELRKIHGLDHLSERIGGYVFKIHPNVFFQTNSYQALTMVKLVEGMLGFKTSDVLLDLYCGTGLFGLSLCNYVKKVIGVELDHNAVECARINSELNDVKNAEFIEGGVENVLGNIKGKVDLLILDPPRPGLHPKVVEAILNLRPREIVYVSCNPVTMARDISMLLKRYSVEGRVQPLDMFPHTAHVEVVAKLVKS